MIAASAVSGAVGLAAWVVFAVVSAVMFDGAEEFAVLGASLIMTVVALVWFVLAPLAAGLLGGFVSRDVRAVPGSILGYLAVMFGATLIQGNSSPSIEATLVVGILSAVLVVSGHLPGALLRPRPRTA